jgi:3-hydroxyisobutyrate dehydrogenase-like beta-hydroxyacid dehydrogenase
MAVIGFIGIGIMGESMSANIVKAGHEVYVYDLNKEQVKKLVDLGAKAADSVADVAKKCKIIIIMVPKSEHVVDVVEKLLPNLQEDTIVCDMSTISPTVSKNLAKKVAEKKAIMLDAPVVKSKAAAITGDLGILVGGDEGAFELIKPILKCMGKNIIRMGPNGAGLAMKLCHNYLVAQIQEGVNEMLTLATQAGLEYESIIKAISFGGGQNFYLDSKGETIKKRDFSPKFPFEHMEKDIKLTEEFASDIGLKLPGLDLVKRVYEEGIKSGLAREDFSASIKIVEKLAKNE